LKSKERRVPHCFECQPATESALQIIGKKIANGDFSLMEGCLGSLQIVKMRNRLDIAEWLWMSRRFGPIPAGGGSNVVVGGPVLDPRYRINGLLGRRFCQPTDSHKYDALTVCELKEVAESLGKHLTRCKGGVMVAVTTKAAIKRRLLKYDHVHVSECLQMLCTDTVVHQLNPMDDVWKRHDLTSI
jgi:hypothetical protein